MNETRNKPGLDKRSKRRQERYGAKLEIEKGFSQYFSNPRSKEGLHPEEAGFFEVKVAQEPLRRPDIEQEAEDYIDRNFNELLPLLLTEKFSQGKAIKQLDLTNELIGSLGANYYIREEDGELAIFHTNAHNLEGQSSDELDFSPSASDLIALAYAKDAIRIDTQNEVNNMGGKISHRYYLKSQGRYLCENDFGMRVWDPEKGKMTAGKVNNAAVFVHTIRQQVERIKENLGEITPELTNQIQGDVFSEIEVPNEDSDDYSDEIIKRQEKIHKIVNGRVVQKLLQQFEQNPGDKKLVLEAVPIRKVRDQLHFQYPRIAKKYGLIGDEPLSDYQDFQQNGHKKIEALLREPNDDERVGTTLDFVYSNLFRKPVITGGSLNIAALIERAKGGVRDVLADNAAQVDEATKAVFELFRCPRGEQSPHFYHDYILYDFIQAIGTNCAKQILDSDDRNVSQQMKGYELMRAMGYDISDFESNNLSKQLHEASKLYRSQIWEYFEEREKITIEEARTQLGEKTTVKHWLELLGEKKAQDLFSEGKKMHWLAQQIFMNSPYQSEESRFYRKDASTNWSRYDLTKLDVSKEKLKRYLDTNISLIAALLVQNTKRDQHYGEQQETEGTPATLSLIITALDSGKDLKGVAIAHNKQRYLKGIHDEIPNDLEFALQDWPVEWRKAISIEEIRLYYEHASDYVQIDPNGLVKYAEWRATPEGMSWTKLFIEAPKNKSDLDFRICLGSQTEEIRGWYKSGAEYVGSETMQSYLMRFNATRDSNGLITNWHDVLYWIPNINNLEAANVKSILSSIQTMDENHDFIKLLPRYDKKHDPLLEQGDIQSVRELKKRILAIESNIDLSSFKEELIEITTAPGFNLSALQSMSNRVDFKNLLEGELDRNQPFKPHKIIFAHRLLTEALQEGLGSHRKNIKGTAKSPKKLFRNLKSLIKDRTIGEKNMLVTDLLNNVPVDLEEEIIALLQVQNVNIGPTIEAQIHAKSDPAGWVCGNYTDCCMPFGSEISNHYMFNPITQYFTITYNGRIVAQSVVVDAYDRRDDSDVITLDNIEVAKNYKHLLPLIDKAYQAFWSRYTSKPVKVGTGYLDLIPTGSKLEPNNYQPRKPLYYSDSRGKEIYNFPKNNNVQPLDKMITFANLTERDAEIIAQMEAETYSKEMTQGKPHISEILQQQSELDVPGAASSFIIRQGDQPAGYLLILPEKSKFSDERVAHIHDMVILPKFQGAGLARKMIERVLEIATVYKISIEAEARASTSYALLMNEGVRTWIESKGFYLTKNEKLSQYLGDEDFYFVRFENRQN